MENGEKRTVYGQNEDMCVFLDEMELSCLGLKK
jgi:hypothetical protein